MKLNEAIIVQGFKDLACKLSKRKPTGNTEVFATDKLLFHRLTIITETMILCLLHSEKYTLS